MGIKLETNETIIIKSLGVICIILQILVLFFLVQIPTKGYELSIYSDIPLFIWIFLIISVIGGSSIIIYQILSSEDNKQFWAIGLFILIFSYMIFILLFIIKNYTFYDYADPISHLARIKDITLYGHFGTDNFYPIMHVWTTSIAEITGISPMVVIKYIPSFLSLLFIIFMYLVATVIFSNKKKIILTSMLATIPCLFADYYVTPLPNAFSFMIFPLILYLYFKRSVNVQFKLLLVIFLVIIPFSHPLTSIMLLIFLVAIELSYNIYHYLTKPRSNKYSLLKILVSYRIFKISVTPILILLVTFLTWILPFNVSKMSLLFVLLWTKLELTPLTGQVANIFQKLGLSFSERIILFLKVYGSNIILLALSLFAFVLIIKRLLVNTKITENKDKLIFSIMLCSLLSGLVILLFVFTGDPNIQPLRSVGFVFLATVPLAGYGLYEICQRIKLFSFKKFIIFAILIICLITSAFITAAFSLYDSPYTLEPSRQVTQAHISGMTWFFTSKNSSIDSITLEASSPWRFGELTYGFRAKEKRIDLDKYKSWTRVPDHLGYPNNKTLGENYPRDKYFTIEKVFVLSYTKLWTHLNRYNNIDFKTMEKDPTVNRIYFNGDVDVRFVYPWH